MKREAGLDQPPLLWLPGAREHWAREKTTHCHLPIFPDRCFCLLLSWPLFISALNPDHFRSQRQPRWRTHAGRMLSFAPHSDNAFHHSYLDSTSVTVKTKANSEVGRRGLRCHGHMWTCTRVIQLLINWTRALPECRRVTEDSACRCRLIWDKRIWVGKWCSRGSMLFPGILFSKEVSEMPPIPESPTGMLAIQS